MTVADHEVLPVFKAVARVTQVGRKIEIVIGPCKAFSPTEGETVDLHIFVRVVEILVVVAVAVADAIQIIIIGIVVSGVIVTVADVSLLREECRERQ